MAGVSSSRWWGELLRHGTEPAQREEKIEAKKKAGASLPSGRVGEPGPRGNPFEAPALCEHYYCRCMLAAELAAMDMLEAAIEVHFKRVRCRVKEGR